MNDNTDESALVARADAAAAQRRFGEALEFLKTAIAGGARELETFLKAASLYRANKEPRPALALVDRALELEPLHFVTLFLRAGLLEQLAEPGVGEAYERALAQRGAAPLPPPMQAAVTRAESIVAGHKNASLDALTSALAPALDEATDLEGERMRRFASNSVRETQVHHSEPVLYHYPGLPEYEFHHRSHFPWLDHLEAASEAIGEELGAVMRAERAELVPYVTYDDAVPMQQWKPLNRSLDWTAIHLLFRGDRVEANARHCPRTMELLARLPQPDLPGSGPNAMFSLLKPGTHIPPHHGVANFRLVCHLPLIVPNDCWFRVGATRRKWIAGEAFVFDDTIEHEAANQSDELRVVLIFDVWHPALSEIERRGIVAMMAATPGLGTQL